MTGESTATNQLYGEETHRRKSAFASLTRGGPGDAEQHANTTVLTDTASGGGPTLLVSISASSLRAACQQPARSHADSAALHARVVTGTDEARITASMDSAAAASRAAAHAAITVVNVTYTCVRAI
jgi:hypothetical protein